MKYVTLSSRWLAICILFASILTISCSPFVVPLKESEMVPSTTPRATSANSRYQNAVAVARKLDKPNKLEWALEWSLKNAGWLHTNTYTAKYVISISDLQENRPQNDFGTAVAHVAVSYVVRDAKSKIVLTERISTEAEATFSDRPHIVERGTYAVEQAYKKNLAQFMAKLESYGASAGATTNDTQRPDSSAPDRQHQYLVQMLAVHDLYGSWHFTDYFPPKNFGYYRMTDLLTDPDAKVMDRLREASPQQLQTFIDRYSDSLNSAMTSAILALKAEKSKPKEQRQQSANQGKTVSPRADDNSIANKKRDSPTSSKRGEPTSESASKAEKKPLDNPF